ncbi:Dap1p [Sugiyamaella lignohabitans]|uniref:Dap1p n=1 Tax=Sugiyamaella lignohabitans TaxID=796027 RepID=A0A167E017_9ASCO|nr:Dap1p [Sugiyamaella lignohabitans]ANB13490.1 Dap1p [Sugiyamaella lignohabitans]
MSDQITPKVPIQETTEGYHPLVKWGFGILILLFAIRKFFFKKQNLDEDDDGVFLSKLEPLEFIDYTPSTLQKFNGKDDPHVLLAVHGKVYDVSAGRSFYGPGGPYANFAGRDASRGLALNSFDEAVLTPIEEPIDLLDDLTEGQQNTLNDWKSLFESKYPVVGSLVNEPKHR